ncbi:hypothetical protein C8J56DRAFT_125637 [Mycena floridula]|nr:hypothetical protein C8J56DRAFT_125637 [Mycena floridula]
MSSWNLPTRTCTQAVDSTTFLPPASSHVSIPEVFEWHGKHSPNHPLFVYWDETDEMTHSFTWLEASQAVARGGKYVSDVLGPGAPGRVVGLCSSADTITYLLTLVSIMKAGFTAFMISPKASPVALDHLISSSRVAHILVDDGAPRTLRGATLSHHLSWSGLCDATLGMERKSRCATDLDTPCLIIHSSGSTTLPKLNVWTHRMLLPSLWQPWYGELDICGEIMSTASIPMSGGGGIIQLMLAASSGLIISAFKPQVPATIPTPENVWKSMVDTGSTMGFFMQSCLNLWSQDTSRRDQLAKLKCVAFGIGPLDKAVGDILAESGVNLVSLFGSSECAVMSNIFPKTVKRDWQYFSLYKLLNTALQPQGDGLFELIIKTSNVHRPARTNIEGYAFATGDLLEPHPHKAGFWKCAGRKDDQLILPSGMKINAMAFEKMLMKDRNIAGAVIFSTSTVFGVILEPVAKISETEFKELIRPTMEQYNALAAEPARISEQMILIATPQKSFTYGEKGFPRRKAVVELYKSEINSLR